jgi:hypothetical protein
LHFKQPRRKRPHPQPKSRLTKPELCPYNGHQALALRQAAERVLAPTAKDDDLLWLVLLSRTVEQFAQERFMFWPVGGERSNGAETAREIEEDKRRLDEEERKERLARYSDSEAHAVSGRPTTREGSRHDS